jgi:hypothetical protein
MIGVAVMLRFSFSFSEPHLDSFNLPLGFCLETMNYLKKNVPRVWVTPYGSRPTTQSPLRPAELTTHSTPAAGYLPCMIPINAIKPINAIRATTCEI